MIPSPQAAAPCIQDETPAMFPHDIAIAKVILASIAVVGIHGIAAQTVVLVPARLLVGQMYGPFDSTDIADAERAPLRKSLVETEDAKPGGLALDSTHRHVDLAWRTFLESSNAPPPFDVGKWFSCRLVALDRQRADCIRPEEELLAVADPCHPNVRSDLEPWIHVQSPSEGPHLAASSDL
jgi:hypothetical protein